MSEAKWTCETCGKTDMSTEEWDKHKCSEEVACLRSRIAMLEPMGDVQILTDKIVEWATETFGDRQTTAIPVVRHLQKEVNELLETLETGGNYSEEFADCFMLLLESANTQKISVIDLVALTYQKLEKNKKRKWGLPNADGTIEHIQ